MQIIHEVLNIRKNFVSNNPIPLSIAVNITGRCNLKCTFCEKSLKGAPVYEIDTKDVIKLIDFGVEHNCSIFMAGGEPFLHKGIWDILQYCKDRGKKISIVTNGTLFERLTPHQYKLLEDAIRVMSISLDAGFAEEHDRLRGVDGTFDKISRFLHNPLRKNRVAVSSILMPDLKNTRSTIDFSKKMGLSINFIPLIFESNFTNLEKNEWKKEIKKSLNFSEQNMKDFYALEEYIKKSGITTNISLILKFIDKYFRYANTEEYFFDHIIKNFQCVIPFQQLTVDERGIISPCSYLPGEVTIRDGDIYENWKKSALNCREKFSKGARFKVCRSCSCFFAENFRSNIVKFPFNNKNHLLWFFSYYIKRALAGEGRKI